jgi:hypothetical protein
VLVFTREHEAAALSLLMLGFLLVSPLQPWYLLPLVALIALRRDRLRWIYLLAATLLGLLYYPAGIWAWTASGFSYATIIAFQALLLAAPMMCYLGAQLAQTLRRSPE